jgi:glutamine synthetase
MKNQVRETLKDVDFLRLLYTDMLGAFKNVEVPKSQFNKALDGEIAFDGSSIQGFTRIEESDMLLKPDLSTLRIYSPDQIADPSANVAQDPNAEGWLICDVYRPEGTPFEGCPRQILKRQTEKAEALGYKFVTGPEAEFFLFKRGENGITLETNDKAGYFDVAPLDKGDEARRAIVIELERLGFEIEAAHHEVAPGQHEINFKFDDAVKSADAVMIFKMVVKKVAHQHGLYATFMPKPIFGENGSGMHTNQSLLYPSGADNHFWGQTSVDELSDIAHHYIGGILEHAKAFVAITNPLVNSYKRLVPGYEAPINIAWSEKNRSPLVRIPAKRGLSTRVEVRVPDPSCNPYLAFAVMLASGLDGVQNEIKPPAPVNENIFEMGEGEKLKRNIQSLPSTLGEALDHLEKDTVLRECLGEHLYEQYVEAKRQEILDYMSAVHPWEIDRYLSVY